MFQGRQRKYDPYCTVVRESDVQVSHMTHNSIITDLLNRKRPRANQRRAMAMDVLRYLLTLEAITEQKEVL